jgi:hypothetical protein
MSAETRLTIFDMIFKSKTKLLEKKKKKKKTLS